MGIKFQLVAYTDAAGKFTPGAYLNGNEDNFYIDDNLKDDVAISATPGEAIILSDEGMIMAVADGMGGMNAGEVASDIAVSTVKEFFTSSPITPEQASSFENRRDYLEKVIRECDKRIKEDAKRNPEHEGMGSTIIIAWIANGEATVSWLGDSRAYRYNPATGLQPLSKDHSYVQSLVDKGVITYDQAFDHPQGNIIMRSLGDTANKPKPESRNFTVSDGDLFILCSDGLSGVLRDKKGIDPTTGMPYPEGNIEDIVAENYEDVGRCRERLFQEAERGGWYDNVTVVLCKILSTNSSENAGGNAGADEEASAEGGDDNGSLPPGGEGTQINNNQAQAANSGANISKSIHIKITKSTVIYIVIGILVVIAAIVGAIYFLMSREGEEAAKEAEQKELQEITAAPTDSVSAGQNQEAPEITVEKPAEDTPKDSEAATKKKINEIKKENDKKKLEGIPKTTKPSASTTGLTPSDDPDSQKPDSVRH